MTLEFAVVANVPGPVTAGYLHLQPEGLWYLDHRLAG